MSHETLLKLQLNATRDYGIIGQHLSNARSHSN